MKWIYIAMLPIAFYIGLLYEHIHHEVKSFPWKPPELTRCSCDDAVFGITEEEYEQLIIYSEATKHVFGGSRF